MMTNEAKNIVKVGNIAINEVYRGNLHSIEVVRYKPYQLIGWLDCNKDTKIDFGNVEIHPFLLKETDKEDFYKAVDLMHSKYNYLSN